EEKKRIAQKTFRFNGFRSRTGGESGIGSPSIQPLQTVAESLLGRFPFNVSSIIASVSARLLAPACHGQVADAIVCLHKIGPHRHEQLKQPA
ncbi:hypothetical protein, partial [Xanthomonas campestris]|uniref:hypothetical protein n=1 Tax=Xanthomonas campestris TaxID=339 RepID=UPI0031C86531|nr:hypothetical protein [Xanthomonas campestris]